MTATRTEPAERMVRVPQQRRSHRTREAVLRAAVACFEASGFDETTTEKIAQRAGISVGSVYSYFRDKREILLELLDSTLAEIAALVAARLDAAAWKDSDPREVVRDLIDTVFHTHTVRPGLQRIMWERQFKDEEFHARVEEIRAGMRETVRGAIDELGRRGLARDIDSDIAAAVVLNAVQWNAAHVFMYGTPEAIDVAAAATADMVLRYLFVD